MITLTRFDGRELIVNADLVLFIESKPDTIVTLTTGERLIVKESAQDVVSRVVTYKQLVYRSPQEKKT